MRALKKFKLKLFVILVLTILGLALIFKDYGYNQIFYQEVFVKFSRANNSYPDLTPYTYISNIRGGEVYNLITNQKNMTINFIPLSFEEIKFEDFKKDFIKEDSLIKILDRVLSKQKDTNYYRFYIVDIDSLNQKTKISRSIPQKIYVDE
jgi:hypothetical protein